MLVVTAGDAARVAPAPRSARLALVCRATNPGLDSRTPDVEGGNVGDVDEMVAVEAARARVLPEVRSSGKEGSGRRPQRARPRASAAAGTA